MWRRAVVLPGLAAAVAGLAVSAGLVVADESPDRAAMLMSDMTRASDTDTSELRRTMNAEREQNVSRSDRRTGVDGSDDRSKAALLEREAESGGQETHSENLGGGDPRAIAQALLPEFGFSSDQFSCLDALWVKESGWNVAADNPTSSAYGIPQALPGSKMASAGGDWATNPATQIRWGLGYIAERYGSPCSAWSHSQANNWY